MIDLTAKFLKELSVDFERIIATDEAVCEVFATDNSIYHRLPLAVVFPKSTADVRKICFLAAKPEFRKIILIARVAVGLALMVNH